VNNNRVGCFSGPDRAIGGFSTLIQNADLSIPLYLSSPKVKVIRQS